MFFYTKFGIKALVKHGYYQTSMKKEQILSYRYGITLNCWAQFLYYYINIIVGPIYDDSFA